jgi:hypothetical protein
MWEAHRKRQVLDSVTQPNRSVVEMMRRRLGGSSTYRTSIVDIPIIVPLYRTSRSLYPSFSARIIRRSVRLESQVVLGASLIPHTSESVRGEKENWLRIEKGDRRVINLIGN